MKIEFLKKVEKCLQEDSEFYLATVVSESLSNLKLDMGDKILITGEEEIHLTCNVNDKLKRELIAKIIGAADKNRQGLVTREIAAEEVQFFLQSLQSRPKLYIFGAGHVSSPLAEIAHLAGFEVRVIDDREDLMTRERFPEETVFHLKPYEEFLQEFYAGTEDYIVIVTPGHLHDYEVIKSIIHQDWRYLGMIGSTRKVNLIFEELQEETDIEKNRLEQVDAPIGKDIGSETPEEIAVSIAAALISARRCED